MQFENEIPGEALLKLKLLKKLFHLKSFKGVKDSKCLLVAGEEFSLEVNIKTVQLRN